MTTFAGPPQIPGVSGLQLIGSGGFGTVYRGVQHGLDRTVAVKVLHVDKLDRKALKAFRREAKLMTQLSQHRNVPDVYHADVLAGDRPYLIFQFCPRGALDASRRLPAPRVIEIGAKIAEVLALAHREGIVHRDVKPGNILVADNGEPLLTDFGLSLQPSHDQSMGIDSLSPAYAAPEVLEASNAAPAADVYSLGATLFALLTSTTPFPRRAGEPLLAWITRVKSSPIPDPGPGVPAELVSMLRGMLAARPEDRPAAAAVANSMRALWHQLYGQQRAEATTRRADVAGAPLVPHTVDETRPRADAREPGATPGTPPGRGRRYALIGGAAAAGLLATGVLAVTLWPDPKPDSTSTAPSARPPISAASATPGAAKIVLAEPKDQGSFVDLQWTGPAGLQYVVIIGEAGKPEQYKIVNRQTTARLDVPPGTALCFRVQGADATGPQGESNVVGIRGAVCRFT